MHRLVWTTFQDVAFDGFLADWSEAGSSDPSEGNRLDVEVLRASSEALSGRFAQSYQIFKVKP